MKALELLLEERHLVFRLSGSLLDMCHLKLLGMFGDPDLRSPLVQKAREGRA